MLDLRTDDSDEYVYLLKCVDDDLRLLTFRGSDLGLDDNVNFLFGDERGLLFCSAECRYHLHSALAHPELLR
jgi:hypothetical protein